MTVLFAYFAATIAFCATGVVLAVAMVTFGIHEIPNYSLGVWFVWALAWGIGAYFYLRRHPLL